MISCKVSTVQASFRPAKIGYWKTYRRGDMAINFFSCDLDVRWYLQGNVSTSKISTSWSTILPGLISGIH